MSSTNNIYQPNSFPFKRNKNKVLHGNNCTVSADSYFHPLYASASVTQLQATKGDLYSAEFNVMDAKEYVDEMRL